jgi:hypothetical protein
MSDDHRGGGGCMAARGDDSIAIFGESEIAVTSCMLAKLRLKMLDNKTETVLAV